MKVIIDLAGDSDSESDYCDIVCRVLDEHSELLRRREAQKNQEGTTPKRQISETVMSRVEDAASLNPGPVQISKRARLAVSSTPPPPHSYINQQLAAIEYVDENDISNSEPEPEPEPEPPQISKAKSDKMLKRWLTDNFVKLWAGEKKELLAAFYESFNHTAPETANVSKISTLESLKRAMATINLRQACFHFRAEVIGQLACDRQFFWTGLENYSNHYLVEDFDSDEQLEILQQVESRCLRLPTDLWKYIFSFVSKSSHTFIAELTFSRPNQPINTRRGWDFSLICTIARTQEKAVIEFIDKFIENKQNATASIDYSKLRSVIIKQPKRHRYRGCKQIY